MKNPTTSRVRLTRTIDIPDEIKLARFAKAPELGPKILFFSGGSALAQTSTYLTRYTHNSIHIITPFDSGGSSAVLREEFNMPAVGDLRSRIMAIADRSLTGNIEVIELFSYRLPHDKTNEELKGILYEMIQKKHSLIDALPSPVQEIICSYLLYFYNRLPSTFSLQGASIGNIILASGYLSFDKQLDSVIYLFSQLVGAKGIVRPVSDIYAHLCVELKDGSQCIGQDRFTGKNYPAISSPIKKIWLTPHLNSNQKLELYAPKEIIKLIKNADLICYPMGSFFSSLIANLLPEGIGNAIKENPCPKIFIPSTGKDPECLGYTLDMQAEALLDYLRADSPAIQNKDVLNYILLDKEIALGKTNKINGIECIYSSLVFEKEVNLIQPDKLVSVLLSLC